ncbi:MULTISPECIES: hypothetical protein [Vibrio harveyi group]|uniref:hypothetical protein n=1 Tax=Vibrio harveyi group TaxID=717610 RepID=UPI0015F4D816|nr:MULTISPECIES: hypothetical protein [Vibrio harveyi group]MDF4635221.1 hypothetical protein [Vibrio parahaemolyticus]MDG2619288.1 hypothetical protein [Vibrio parahaemolyticus]MDV5036894.1 hypothetical protein [Vibrio diabolicus]MDV5062248.1 hypothetical protein [Vibrio diabolicus]HBH7879294.1 hypothetical protein [Vibrio parahaemolyticus]
MKFVLYFGILVLAAAVGFVVHVVEVEWLRVWVSEQMTGKMVTPSWDVRYIAMILSIEHSVAFFIIYLLLRQKIGDRSLLVQVTVLSVLILAFKSLLIRQPLMDYIIGNPVHVVAAQNLLKWSIPISMSVIIVIGYSLVEKLCDNRKA